MPLRMAIPAAEISVSSSSTKWQKNASKESKNVHEKESKPTKKNQTKNKESTQNFDSSSYLIGVIIFLLGCLTSALITRHVLLEKVQPNANIAMPLNTTAPAVSNAADQNKTLVPRPTFAMYTFRTNQDNLKEIRHVLKLLGYTEVPLEDDWNLLWGFETPFPAYAERIKQIGAHQMINHMPGMNHIAYKVDLSTSGSPFMPPAFKLPKDKKKFLEYAEKNADKLFVEKGNGHRRVSIKKPHDINLESNDTFIQQFLTNPYLVDGYKFDIGVYTVITSVEPLQLYIYTGDVMFRYCPVKFHPFDPDVLQKYVVGDDYRPTWNVPSLKKYFVRFGGGMRASFDAYVRDQGQDPAKIWEQAEEVIRYTVLSKASKIAAAFEKYPRQNFFELIRVDMIIDTDFKVNLIEINLSPNMQSNKFKHNHIVFQQALYNALRLVGVGSPIKPQHDISSYGQIITAVTANKSISSNLNECAELDCHRACDDELACSTCLPCLNDLEYSVLAKAQREHIHRGDMKRIFPKPILDVKNFDLEEETKNMTVANQILTKWFYHKCLYDRSWCQ